MHELQIHGNGDVAGNINLVQIWWVNKLIKIDIESDAVAAAWSDKGKEEEEVIKG